MIVQQTIVVFITIAICIVATIVVMSVAIVPVLHVQIVTIAVNALIVTAVALIVTAAMTFIAVIAVDVTVGVIKYYRHIFCFSNILYELTGVIANERFTKVLESVRRLQLNSGSSLVLLFQNFENSVIVTGNTISI
jgi:SepF-like predicted cell division protein (DUF552 family)